MFRPIDIARKFNISTSTVRNYEESQFIPPAKRSETGYRSYSDRHVSFLRCVLAMRAGFSREEILEISKAVQEKRVNDALLMCSEKQTKLMRELNHAQSTVKLFTSGNIYSDLSLKKLLTIQQTAELTQVPETTIRHWERERLIKPKRGKHNNYRLYDVEQIKRLLIIRTVKTAVWSLEHVRDVLATFDNQKPEEVYKVAVDSMNYLYRLNIHQHQGIHALYNLCLEEGLVAENYVQDYTFNINL